MIIDPPFVTTVSSRKAVQSCGPQKVPPSLGSQSCRMHSALTMRQFPDNWSLRNLGVGGNTGPGGKTRVTRSLASSNA